MFCQGSVGYVLSHAYSQRIIVSISQQAVMAWPLLRPASLTLACSRRLIDDVVVLSIQTPHN